MADLDERLQEQLRDLARDAEPSIRIAAPESVRARGRLRRIRKRATTAAAAVFAAVVLTVGSWQLLPGNESSATPPSVLPDTAKPSAYIPQDALLPTTALPFDASAHWKLTRTKAYTGTKAPEMLSLSDSISCRPTGDGAAPKPVSARARTYLGRDKEQERARHSIAAYDSERSAATAFTSLRDTVKARCGFTELSSSPSAGTPQDPVIVVFGWRSKTLDASTQVVLMRSGTNVAVAQASGDFPFNGMYTDDVSTYCMSISLWHLDRAAAPSPAPFQYNPEGAERRC